LAATPAEEVAELTQKKNGIEFNNFPHVVTKKFNLMKWLLM